MGLPRRCAALLPHQRAGRRRPSAGRSLLSDSGQRGAAARSLDGSALTRWGARTSVRGPTTAPRPCSLSSSPALRQARAAEIVEGRRKVGARVSAVAVRGVLIGRNGRSAVGSTRTTGIVRAALRPRRGARPRRFAGQAHVAAWVAARAWEWQAGLRVELG